MIDFLLDDPLEVDDESWTKAMVKGKAAPEMLDADHRGARRRRALGGRRHPRRHRGRRPSRPAWSTPRASRS